MRATGSIIIALTLGISGDLRAEDKDAVCPLSDKRQSEAIDAFGKLSPIFREPRCFNCHGGVSPFGPGRGQHPVSAFKVVFLDKPDAEGNRIEDFTRTFAGCADCHSEIAGPGDPPGWRLAPSSSPRGDMRWIDVPGMTPKSTVALCRQMKKLFPEDAPRFLRHMDNDEGKVAFLDVAFTGMMALNQNGQNQADKGVELPKRPSSMTRPEMFAHSKEWVDAMGNEFHDPEECGCLKMEYALRVKFHGVFMPPAGGASVRVDFETEDSQAEPAVIPIHFNDDGAISGNGTLGGKSAGAVNARGAVVCEAGGKQSIGAVVNGIWPAARRSTNPQKVPGKSAGSKMEIKLDVNGLAAQGAGRCVDFLGRVYTGGSNKVGKDVYSLKFSLAPVVGETQTVPWNVPLPGWSGSAQVTLIRIK